MIKIKFKKFQLKDNIEENLKTAKKSQKSESIGNGGGAPRQDHQKQLMK